MKAEIISIGSELLLGQIIDTNTSYLAKRLAENGIELIRSSIVGDHLDQIEDAIGRAISQSHIVLTTGGIGPTEDDLTREAVAAVFDRPLLFQPHLMEQIEALFKRRGFRMAENNRKQAFIPEGAIPIENPKGTAPGFIVEYLNGALISIPGVPSEMEFLMETSVIPYLKRRFKLQDQIIQYKVLRACGLGESAIGLQIRDLMKQNQNPQVGTLASLGDIKIRITAKADSPEEASTLIKKMENEIRNRLGSLIYGVDDETLHGSVAKELERLDLTLSLVETFTAGIMTQKLASTASQAMIKAMVLPSEQSQSVYLKISEDEALHLRNDPEKMTGRLALAAKEETKAALGMATYGVISGEQGRGEYRVETFYAIATDEGIEKQQYSLGGELWMVRERASIIALDILRKYLMKIKGE